MRFFLPINQHIMNIIKSSIFFLLAFLISCFDEKKLIKRPNIVWLVAEDLGLYIPSFGDSTISTPNLGRLAEEGVRYNNVYSVLKRYLDRLEQLEYRNKTFDAEWSKMQLTYKRFKH